MKERRFLIFFFTFHEGIHKNSVIYANFFLIITDERMKDSYLFKAATEKQGHHIMFVSLQ